MYLLYEQNVLGLDKIWVLSKTDLNRHNTDFSPPFKLTHSNNQKEFRAAEGGK